jgi:hypothetical protein
MYKSILLKTSLVMFAFLAIILLFPTQSMALGECNTHQCDCVNGCVDQGDMCDRNSTCKQPDGSFKPCIVSTLCKAGPSPCSETSCIPPVPPAAYICYGGSGTSDDGSCYVLSKVSTSSYSCSCTFSW